MTVTIEVPDFGTVHDAPWLEVCYHEAGHAVIARVLGFVVVSVVARSEGDGVCHVHPAPAGMPAREQVRCDQIIDAAGGAVSERALGLFAHQHAGEASRRAHWAVGSDLAMCESRNGQPGAIGWDRAYAQAEELADRHWARIEDVAYALAESGGHLSGGEV